MVKSGEKWEKVGKWEKVEKVGKSSEKWLKVGKSGEKWHIKNHLATCSSSEVIMVLLSNFNLVIDFKGYFHNIRKSNWDLCYIFRPISQNRCMLRQMFV